MGLFDFLKKKKLDNQSTKNEIPKGKNSEKCAECMYIIEGSPWKLGEKHYCQLCYNRRMAHGLRGFAYQKFTFEMPIDDIFSIRNHGVAVTGTIRKGCIYRGDVVIVNDCEYTVTQIDVIPNEVESAKIGMNVALHLSTRDASLFKRGDIITLKPLQENKKDTFTCDVCGKEFPAKYRHKGNTCADCAETTYTRKMDVPSNDQPAGNKDSNNAPKDTPRFIQQSKQENGTVSKEKATQSASLDTIISKYRVSCNYTVEQQREWLTVLSKTIPTIMLGGNPLCVDYFLEPHMLEEAGNMLNTVRRIAFTVEKMLSITNMEKALNIGSVFELVQVYCILIAYANMLKEPHNSAINDSREYIYDVLKKTDFSQLITAAPKNKLYWAPAIYDGDPLILPVPDYDIHVFPTAGQMIIGGEKIPCDGAVPEGYTFAQKTSGRVMHLRTIRNQRTDAEMIPLFTDLNLLLQIFTPKTRVSVVDYQTACRLCLQDRNVCSGIIINPGKDNRIISVEELMKNG